MRVAVGVPGGELHVEEHGVGEALLLLQGLGQALWAWRYQLPFFAERRRTIAFDTRGTGRSFRPTAPYTVDDLAGDARAVLDALAVERTDLVGFSMGGYVALTLALAAPERIGALVLAATGAGGPGRVPRPAHVREAFDAAFGIDPAEFGRRTMPYTFSPGFPEREPERFEEILAARLEHPTPYETIQAHVDACYRFYDAALEIERIEHRALVLHGDADLIVPVENGRMLAARLPNARYVELEGRGHNLMLEDPDTFNELVESFLRQG